MQAKDLLIAPTRGFWVTDTVERFDDLLAWPFLDRLDTFWMGSGVPPGDWLAKTLACKGFCNVRRLSLSDCSASQVESLLTAWQDHRLTKISLSGAMIGDEGFRMLMNHPALPSVREIGISNIGLTAAGVRALAESSYHPPVTDVRMLGWNPIGDEGVAELLRWPGLSRIKTLSLHRTEMTDAGASMLAKCEALGSLEKLWLSNNQIGEAGAAALSISPNLANLDELYIQDNPIPSMGLRLLETGCGERLKSPR
jgi:hypothetical protein